MKYVICQSFFEGMSLGDASIFNASQKVGYREVDCLEIYCEEVDHDEVDYQGVNCES